MKILIIDDEILITKSLERIFNKNHQVQVANDGTSGLQKWREFDPDLVVLDFIMPGLNADQIIQQKPKDTKAKVCLISAYIGDSETETQILKKVDLFISKPFEDIVLVSKKILELVGA
jgi:CheY-like chemotaxis protein